MTAVTGDACDKYLLLKGNIKTNAFSWYTGQTYTESPEASGRVSIRKAGASGK